MPSLIEYEFTLPDGTTRHEMVADRREVFIFQKMHGATRAIPVDIRPDQTRAQLETRRHG